MKHVIKSEQRGRTKINWLDSYHSFSFGEYYDPNNMDFGPLRVFNDDTILPSGGFPTHPHRDMEIITIVIEGAVAHRDSTGSEGMIRPGEIQKMSAGKGILHSEFNASDKHLLKLYQIWIIPNQMGLKPSYEEHQYNEEELHNQLHLVASGDINDGVVFINQDVKMFLSKFDSGYNLKYNIETNRGVFIHIIDGTLDIDGNELTNGDEYRISQDGEIDIAAKENTKYLLIDMKMDL